jgi:hypothetical protein
MIYWTSFRKYVAIVYDCRMTHWPFCSLKVGMFFFFGSCQSPRWPCFTFCAQRVCLCFCLLLLNWLSIYRTGNINTDWNTYLYKPCFVLPSGICILHFHMLFNSLYYLFHFLSYNLWPIVSCLVGWCVHYYIPWHNASRDIWRYADYFTYEVGLWSWYTRPLHGVRYLKGPCVSVLFRRFGAVMREL